MKKCLIWLVLLVILAISGCRSYTPDEGEDLVEYVNDVSTLCTFARFTSRPSYRSFVDMVVQPRNMVNAGDELLLDNPMAIRMMRLDLSRFEEKVNAYRSSQNYGNTSLSFDYIYDGGRIDDDECEMLWQEYSVVSLCWDDRFPQYSLSLLRDVSVMVAESEDADLLVEKLSGMTATYCEDLRIQYGVDPIDMVWKDRPFEDRIVQINRLAALNRNGLYEMKVLFLDPPVCDVEVYPGLKGSMILEMMIERIEDQA